MHFHPLRFLSLALTIALVLAQPVQSDIRIFRFENVKSDRSYQEMITTIRQVVGVTPELPVDPASGAVTVSASPEKLAIVDFIVRELDGNTGDAGSPLKPHRFKTADGRIVDIFYLDAATSQQSIQEMITVLRQVVFVNRIFYYWQKKAIVFQESPDEAALAEWLIPRVAKQDPATGDEEYKFPGKSDDITRVFHWNASFTPAEAQRLAHDIRTQAEIQLIFTYSDTRAIAVRATAEKLAIVERLVARPAPSN